MQEPQHARRGASREAFSMKKSLNHSTKQLRLAGETLRSLKTVELGAIAGGDVTSTVKNFTKIPADCAPVG
jgi:hypothetical protein